MRRPLISLCALISTLLQATPPDGTWQLEFEDNFDGSTLDWSKWRVGTHSSGINGQAGNVPDNITVSAGKLNIVATDTPSVYSGDSFDYSAGEISSFYNFKQQYGYFEARMKWDNAVGMWPAFWLMPDRGDYGYENYFVNTFMKFDLSAAGIGTVTSAKLRLKVVSLSTSDTTPNNLQTYKVSDDTWDENTITWNNHPTWDPCFIDQKWNTPASPGDVLEIDVTAYVGAEVAGDGVVSLVMSDTYLRTRQMLFHSREATNVADRPELVVNGVTYYPIADAPVRGGTKASTNYGSLNQIEVRSGWGNTSTTQNGGMEIDVIENLGIWGSNKFSQALHWDGYGPDHQSTSWSNLPVDDASEYHDYGVYWEDGLIEFYLDGKKTGSFQDDRVMDVPGYMILSLQLGGWDGNTPTSAVNNKSLDVDYVRAWSGTKSTDVPTTTTVSPDGSILIGSDYTQYGTQAGSGSGVAISDTGDHFSVTGNYWIKFPVNYTVTPNTVLEFTVNAAYAGEILGIGLDEDNDSDNAPRVFQVGGSDTWTNAWSDANNYPADSVPMTYQINVGNAYTGAMAYLVVTADDDASAEIHAAFSDISLTEGTNSAGGSVINIGNLGLGIAAYDPRIGSGYLMYSAQDVATRFNAYTGNADQIIAVYYDGSQWYADRNYGVAAFTPEPTDILLAIVDFTNDTVTSLEGSQGSEFGIEYGYASGDLTYTPDQWNGSANDGEFGVTGTTFTTNGSGAAPIAIGALNNGVAAHDSRTGNGYLMYSSSNVITRFGAYTGNADHIIAVYYDNGEWYADKNFGQATFSPETTDILLASIDFTNDTVISLEGSLSSVNGINSGYTSGDLIFTADIWAGASNDGEFGISGTTFTP